MARTILNIERKINEFLLLSQKIEQKFEAQGDHDLAHEIRACASKYADMQLRLHKVPTRKIKQIEKNRRGALN